MVRVLTVDDQPLFRDAARAVISATPGFEALAEVTSGEDALRLLDRLRPDLVLLDVSLPGIDGLETCRRLTAGGPGPARRADLRRRRPDAARLGARVRRGRLRGQAGAAPGHPAHALGPPRRRGGNHPAWVTIRHPPRPRRCAGAGSGATLRDPGPRPRQRSGALDVRGHGRRPGAGRDRPARAGHRPGRAARAARPDPVARARADRGAPAAVRRIARPEPRALGCAHPRSARARTRADTPARAIARAAAGPVGLAREQRPRRPLVRPPAPRGHGRAPAAPRGARRRPGRRVHARGRATRLGQDRAAERLGGGARRGLADARRPPLRPAAAVGGRLRRAAAHDDPSTTRPTRRRPAAARRRAGRRERARRRSCSTTSTSCAAPRSLRSASCSSTAATRCTWSRRRARDPQLPLERLRLSRPARASCARPTSPSRCEEATALLEELGLSLRPDLVARLLERTEGWAAGLRLAGLSLRGEADPDAFVAEFAGDDRAVADYLTGEVLAGLPPATRELLLRTSIAERVCGGLADALTGGSDGALLLEELERTRHVRRPARPPPHVVPLPRAVRRAAARAAAARASRPRARAARARRGVAGRRRARPRGASRTRSAPAGRRSAATLVADHWLDLLLDGVAPDAITAAADGRGDDARLAVSGASARLALGDPAGAEARLAGGRASDDGDAGRLAVAAAGARPRRRALAAAQSAALLRDAEPGRDGDALRALALFHHGATEFVARPPRGRRRAARGRGRDRRRERPRGAAARLPRARRRARARRGPPAPRRPRRAQRAGARRAARLAPHRRRGVGVRRARRGPLAPRRARRRRAPRRRRGGRRLRGAGERRGAWRRARCAPTSPPCAATSTAPAGCCAPSTRRCPDAGPVPRALARGARPRAVGARRPRRPGRRGRRLAHARRPAGRAAARRGPAGGRPRRCTPCCGCTPG